MNFWDSSALLPLVIQEESTSSLLDLREKSEEIVAWTLSPVEVVSALNRLQRTGSISLEQLSECLMAWEPIQVGLTLIRDVDSVKERALRLLRLHPLKSADALQLASALISCSDVPSEHAFITLDNQLSIAASKEGFRVLPKLVT